MKHICYIIVILLLLFTIFYQWKNPETITVTKTERDTVTIWDTVYKEKPVYKTITKVEKDTVFVSDTVYVVLDRETKIYEDSTYQCQISGIKVDLDWIKVYPKTTYITSEKVVKMEDKRPLLEFKPSVGLGWGITTNKPDVWVGGSLVVNINRKKK